MPDLTATLKKRMSAASHASELETGETAYKRLFEDSTRPTPVPASKICDLPVDKLRTFFTADIGFKPYPPDKLKAFAEELASDGLIERIIVRPVSFSDTYEILAGHNRVAAGRLNGWATIPAEVVQVDDVRAITIATATNLLRRQDLSVVERGKAYKALLEAQSDQGRRTDLQTSGEIRQKFLTREIVAQFFGVTEYEIRKAVKMTCLIPELADILESDPKRLLLSCAEKIADYDAASQGPFVELCSIEGYRLNMAAVNHIVQKCPPPTAARQAVFAAWREARAAAEKRTTAPPRKITFDRKRFEPYLSGTDRDKDLEDLFLEFLKQRAAVR